MCNGNTADLHDYSVSPHLIPGCIGYPTKIPGRTRIQSVLNVIGFGHAMSPTRSISCRARTQAAGYPRKVGIVSDEALNPTRPARVATLVLSVQFSLNKTTLTSTIYHGPSRPPL